MVGRVIIYVVSGGFLVLCMIVKSVSENPKNYAPRSMRVAFSVSEALQNFFLVIPCEGRG